MAGAQRHPTDRVSWLGALATQPYAHDFYQTLRRLDATHAGHPRTGDARRPADEPVRLAQEPSLTFAPANVSSFELREGGRVRLSVRFLGLFGHH